MKEPLPIGVLDSGVGGLSVLTCLQAQLPNESFLYVADSGHAPYGTQSVQAIQERCRHILEFFKQRQVKAVVLACNTATAAAVEVLREENALSIIGMEPAVKPAASITRCGIVGVLATEGTIESDKFLTLKDRFSHQVEVITVACHGWVESIERGDSAQERSSLLKSSLQPMLDKGTDTLILGCTHYPLIRDEIQEIAASLCEHEIEILDTGEAVAKELRRRLLEEQLMAGESIIGQVEFFSSGELSQQQQLFSTLWPEPLQVNLLPA